MLLAWAHQQMAAAGIWTPYALGGDLLAFWDANDASAFTMSGTNVTVWADGKSGYALSQNTGGSMPVRGAEAFGGLPGVTFDGADDYLNMNTQPFPGSCEMWLLVDQTLPASTAGVKCAFDMGGASGTTRYRALRDVLAGANVVRVSNGSISATATGNFSGRKLVRGVFSPTRLEVSVDGGVVSGVNTSTTLGSTGVSMGALVGTPGLFWTGVVNAVLVTSRLTVEQAGLLTDYLKDRGGIV